VSQNNERRLVPCVDRHIGDTLTLSAEGRELNERSKSDGLQLPSHGDQWA
jgi:hypothetical protein